MGVWGARLYSGDFAMDLRSTIGAVARLPFGGDELLDILCDTESAAANARDDPDHTTFWLVVADQFAKRGIVCARARDGALAIIDTGSDLATLERLGMRPADLAVRRHVLAEVRTRIVAPLPRAGPRPVLKNPQPLLMEVGDVFAYPTFGGHCINAYFKSKEQDNKYAGAGGRPVAWTQDGWSACVIVDRGRAFGFLSWYRPLTISMAIAQKPALAALRGDVLWRLAHHGTCSPVHLRRLEMEKLGTLPIDPEKLRHAFPGLAPGTWAAVNDISICNGLKVGPAVPDALMPRPGEPVNNTWGRPYPTIVGIEQILSS
jgi:hypothetical protein